MMVSPYVDKRSTGIAISLSLVLHVCLFISLAQYKMQQPQNNITDSLALQVMLFPIEIKAAKSPETALSEESNHFVELSRDDSKPHPSEHGIKHSSLDNQSTLANTVKQSDSKLYAEPTLENAVLSPSDITEKSATAVIAIPIQSNPPESNEVQSGRPDYAYNPPPEYPLLLREEGIDGTVWVKVWVDSDGHPGAISLIKGSGYRLLDESALNAVRYWRFIPARNAQQTLASWVEFPIRFVLKS